MSRLRQTFPALALVLALLFPASRAAAEAKVTALFTAKATTGVSSTVFFVGANTQDSYAFQVTWTGTAIVNLNATLDGTNWYTVATWSGAGSPALASTVILTAPILGGVMYQLDQTTCSTCSTTAKVTASGAAQVVTF